MTAEIHFSCGGDITRILIDFLKSQEFRRDLVNRRRLHNDGVEVSVEPCYNIATLPNGERFPHPITEVTVRGEPGPNFINSGYALEGCIKQHCGENYTREDMPEPCMSA